MVIEDRERKRKAAPITIRAHHLPHMAWAMGLGLHAGTPASVAALGRKETEGFLTCEDPEDREYAYRTIGSVGQHAPAFEEATRLEMERFVKASPKEECVIVERLIGDVCKRLRRCGLGDHCLREISEDFDLFLTVAEEIRLDKAIRVETVKATFSNAPSQKVRKLYTTVGVVKEVLRYLDKVDGI